ncbi:MAG: PHP domain-containing protein [Clostridia bacterium]|nr:PHP domain-containing protein [Clostridia bacterium]
MMRTDLHIHTYYSDGNSSPAEMVALAKQNGVKLISVTDHDNMNGSKEAKEACLNAGIIAVDGIEISAYDNAKIHVLGYNVNADCTAFKRYYEDSLKGAEERVLDILKKLSKHGVHLSIYDVERERKCKFSPLHSSYVARAACRKGYGSNPGRFYVDYLNLGRCAYSNLNRPSPKEAVKLICDCGGVAVLAHPGRIDFDSDRKINLIKELKDCGLGGIEAVYSAHTDSETAYYKEIAEKFSLLVTGGSDTHFSEGNRKIGTPEFYPDEKLLTALKLI